jgi:hypothetical protein
MRRISSRFTYLHKRVFPVVWFGFLLLFLGISIFAAPRSTEPLSNLPFFIIPIAGMVVGYFLMKKLLFDLVDEVWDDGDTLLVKNRGVEARIALADIKNVGYSQWTNPPRVTLSLRQPTVFGDQVTFSTPVRLVPFTTNPIINELIDRIDAARQRQV